MQVLNVVSILSAREGGGNAERTMQLSRAISAAGVGCTVLTLDIGDPHARQPQLGDAELVVLPTLNKRYQVPRLRWKAVEAQVRKADVIHFMGYWSLLAVFVFLVARRTGVPYVVSPAGALAIFGRSKALKQLFNLVFGRRLLRGAAGWIAVTAGELPDFESHGIDPARVKVLPNGVVESEFEPVPGVSLPWPGMIASDSCILFMGRLDPIKGPDLLLEAFIRIAPQFPGATLVFAGPDGGLQASLEQRAREAALAQRVHFAGFVSGPMKTAAYREASILVVPSRREAMSIVAVEAGVCGTAVLMTDQCGLDDVREIEPRLVVPATVEGLASALCFALEDKERLQAWGERWQDIVRQRYLWRDIGQRFADYLSMLARQRRT
ncbi:glycosyltransferase [Lacisediminimonas profundi]|uniref:glycosyltransferase n=1 Tax=Lacisediminimonas profundi TaxID=2603856 RepID=UPI00124B7BFE|nr:glycosyltransferase [Lacisediminimonas profundi]